VVVDSDLDDNDSDLELPKDDPNRPLIVGKLVKVRREEE